MIAAAALTALAISACGGGGGGGGGSVIPPPTVVFANTSSPLYLPLTPGNSWTFSSGSKFVDVAKAVASCPSPCIFNGHRYDRIDLLDPSGAYSSSFLFTKFFDTSNNNVLTSVLLGTSPDHGQTISFLGSNTNPGIPIMNDSPTQGKTYSANGITSQITAVGQTQPLPDGRTIQNIGIDLLTQSGAQNITFGLAQGVGLTSIAVGTQNATLTTFTIDVANSASEARWAQADGRAIRSKSAAGVPADIANALSKLF